MKYWNSYDIFYKTQLIEIFTPVTQLIGDFFASKEYSIEIEELQTIINCNPFGDYHQRSKFSRKEKFIFFDIVIEFMISKSLEHKHAVIANDIYK